jgi:hypothetical protein
MNRTSTGVCLVVALCLTLSTWAVHAHPDVSSGTFSRFQCYRFPVSGNS